MAIVLFSAAVILYVAGLILVFMVLAARDRTKPLFAWRFPKSFAEYRQMQTPVQFRRSIWATACIWAGSVCYWVGRSVA